jgi:hypothetical protein
VMSFTVHHYWIGRLPVFLGYQDGMPPHRRHT